jgi:hypothetical protein
MEFLFNNRPVRFLSFEAVAHEGRNVLATLNAVSQAVLARFQSRFPPLPPAPPAPEPEKARELEAVPA